MSPFGSATEGRTGPPGERTLSAAFELLLGDCLERLGEVDDASVDAVVTDPPYGISFMGKHWDRFDIEKRVGKRDVSKLGVRLTGGADSSGRKLIARTGSAFANAAGEAGAYDFTATGNRRFQEWCAEWGAECLRVLKPGGHAVVFGGTRTYHRLAAGLEDAGFEIRDCLAWLFGSGFPKSKNIGDGFGTALKPAHEPIVLARKPLRGTVAETFAAHGTGALNIDGCRIETTDDRARFNHARTEGTSYIVQREDGFIDPGGAGRWPANVVLDEEAAAMLDEQTGILTSGPESDRGHRRNADRDASRNTYGGFQGQEVTGVLYGDSGGASRFFYCAKTSRGERNAGLDGFEDRRAGSLVGWAENGDSRVGRVRSDGAVQHATAPEHRNVHPTVKPIALMRWLCRLITPPGGLIVDPFLGSGTTGVAAVIEGFRFVGIEREPDYLAIAQARIDFWAEHGEDALKIAAAIGERETLEASGQQSLLAEGAA